MAEMRKFNTGATRDGDSKKLDYEGFLSPIVLRRYAEYMHKYRMQPDGNLRSSDNWQKLFGETLEEHLDVCMKSANRHMMDWWLEHRGFDSRDGIEEAICGLLFNAMAYLYGLEKERYGKNTSKNS